MDMSNSERRVPLIDGWEDDVAFTRGLHRFRRGVLHDTKRKIRRRERRRNKREAEAEYDDWRWQEVINKVAALGDRIQVDIERSR